MQVTSRILALLKWTDKMINVFVLSVWVLYLCVL